MNRREIEKILLKNAELVSKNNEYIIRKWNNLVLTKDQLFIPGYIPYIGKNYLEVTPKILIYALSQDVTPYDEFIVKYGTLWKNKKDIYEALNRQNINFQKYGMIQMRPFDTGHLPILSGILTFLISKRTELDPIDKVSATNLSKFSFRTQENRTTDNIESLNKCFDWFSELELKTLKPDYIICVGDKVYKIIMNKLKYNKNIKTNIIQVSFPSLQVINSKYRKDLSEKDLMTIEKIKNIFSIDFLNRKTSYKHLKIIDVINRDALYFVKMFEKIENQIIYNNLQN